MTPNNGHGKPSQETQSGALPNQEGHPSQQKLTLSSELTWKWTPIVHLIITCPPQNLEESHNQSL